MKILDVWLTHYLRIRFIINITDQVAIGMELQSPIIKKLLVVLPLVVVLAAGRFVENELNVMLIRRQKGWIFLDRMSFDQTNGSFSLKLKIKSPAVPRQSEYQLGLRIVPDQEWDQEQAFRSEREIRTIARSSEQLIQNINQQSVMVCFEISAEDGWETDLAYDFTISRPCTLHFTLVDYDKAFASENWRRQTRIRTHLEMKNGVSEHGSDERVNSYLFPFLFVMSGLMLYYSKKPPRKQFEQEQIDWGSLLVYVSLIFNIASIGFNWLGFLVYSQSGKMYAAFDFLYLGLHCLSESVLSSLILFVAFGWTITYINDSQFDLYVPLAFMLGIINLILTLLGKINDGNHNKYHMYDTIPSYILVFFRLIAVSVLLWGCIRNMLRFADSDKTIYDFFTRFMLLGSCYFLSLPFIILAANLFAGSAQKQLVFVWVELIKNLVNLILTYMVSSANSKYASAKLVNRSFMQSNNKLL